MPRVQFFRNRLKHKIQRLSNVAADQKSNSNTKQQSIFPMFTVADQISKHSNNIDPIARCVIHVKWRNTPIMSIWRIVIQDMRIICYCYILISRTNDVNHESVIWTHLYIFRSWVNLKKQYLIWICTLQCFIPWQSDNRDGLANFQIFICRHHYAHTIYDIDNHNDHIWHFFNFWSAGHTTCSRKYHLVDFDQPDQRCKSRMSNMNTSVHF